MSNHRTGSRSSDASVDEFLDAFLDEIVDESLNNSMIRNPLGMAQRIMTVRLLHEPNEEIILTILHPQNKDIKRFIKKQLKGNYNKSTRTWDIYTPKSAEYLLSYLDHNDIYYEYDI